MITYEYRLSSSVHCTKASKWESSLAPGGLYARRERVPGRKPVRPGIARCSTSNPDFRFGCGTFTHPIRRHALMCAGSSGSTPPEWATPNGFLRVACQGSRVTSDADLVRVRELDERLGLEAIIGEHRSDSRHALNTQLPLTDLLRQ